MSASCLVSEMSVKCCVRRRLARSVTWIICETIISGVIYSVQCSIERPLPPNNTCMSDAAVRRGSMKNHLGGPGPPKFSLPSPFPYPFPFSPSPPKFSLPSLSPFPSLPFPLPPLFSSSLSFPSPFPLSFPSLPSP